MVREAQPGVKQNNNRILAAQYSCRLYNVATGSVLAEIAARKLEHVASKSGSPYHAASYGQHGVTSIDGACAYLRKTFSSVAFGEQSASLVLFTMHVVATPP